MTIVELELSTVAGGRAVVADDLSTGKKLVEGFLSSDFEGCRSLLSVDWTARGKTDEVGIDALEAMGLAGVAPIAASGWFRKGVFDRVSLVTCITGAGSSWIGFFIRREDFLLLFMGVTADSARNGSFSAAVSPALAKGSFLPIDVSFLLEPWLRLR